MDAFRAVHADVSMISGWQAWLGVYLGIGLTFGLLVGFIVGTTGEFGEFRPDRLAITAIFWPSPALWILGMWLFALRKRILLDEATENMRSGQIYVEISGYLTRHPNATEDQMRIAVRQIVQKHQAM